MFVIFSFALVFFLFLRPAVFMRFPVLHSRNEFLFNCIHIIHHAHDRADIFTDRTEIRLDNILKISMGEN